jgi:hypothetical protein
VDPTPRSDRLTKDYEKEYPSIEVEGRRTLKKKGGENQKNIENVKLDGEVRMTSIISHCEKEQYMSKREWFSAVFSG